MSIEEPPIVQATKRYMMLQTRRAQPYGQYKNKIWIPAKEEQQQCCERLLAIHDWKINYKDGCKWSHVDELFQHCRSLAHVAEVFKVDPITLKQYVETAGWAVKEK